MSTDCDFLAVMIICILRIAKDDGKNLISQHGSLCDW